MLAVVALMLLAADDSETVEPAAVEPQNPVEARSAYLIPVRLPITGNVDLQVKRTIDQVVGKQDNAAAVRPILVIEFRAKGERGGEGSGFERSLSLARYLASDRLSGVRTVAYLPQTITGHAVLAALACEEIIIAEDAEFGDAGAAESLIDDTMRAAYREIANRRRTIPAAIALGMVDRAVAIHKAETLDGTQYVTEDELQALRESGAITSVDSMVAAGDLARFTGRELRLEHGFASHLANDRSELLEALNLPADSLEQDPSLGGDWRPIRVDVNGPISAKSVNWLIRSTKERLDESKAEPVNFVCVAINSPGGSLVDSLRLAGFLAELDPTQVRTVAFVDAEARGDAAIIAGACDHLVMNKSALLGGPGAINLSKREQRESREAIRAIASEKQRDWSLLAALVDPEFEVYRYSADGDAEIRYLSEAEASELDDPGRWTRGELIETARGLSGTEAHNVGLVRHTAGGLAEFRQLYQLEEELEGVEPNWAHLMIERLASPRLAATLLFIGWFALIIEVSQPGISVPGFVSALCFLLFFWSHYLHGTAAWLEILLFGAGVVCLVVEIFVIPGFGVFGFGGACMVIASLVMASQTFIVPKNSYQLGEFANSLMMVAVGFVGAFGSLIVMRRYLPEAPIFRRMMLAAPDEETREELEDRELLADYRHLLGKRGQTTTQLTPSGKARFGDEVINVISDGDLVPRGSSILVAEVRGSRVLVQAAEDLKG
jgi:membrane-bound ClpP family serine protease